MQMHYKLMLLAAATLFTKTLRTLTRQQRGVHLNPPHKQKKVNFKILKHKQTGMRVKATKPAEHVLNAM